MTDDLPEHLTLRHEAAMTARRRNTGASGANGRRELLIAMRTKLAAEFDAAEGRDAAFISKQLADIAREVDSLPTGKESTVDDLAQRRASRRAAAAGQ